MINMLQCFRACIIIVNSNICKIIGKNDVKDLRFVLYFALCVLRYFYWNNTVIVHN